MYKLSFNEYGTVTKKRKSIIKNTKTNNSNFGVIIFISLSDFITNNQGEHSTLFNDSLEDAERLMNDEESINRDVIVVLTKYDLFKKNIINHPLTTSYYKSKDDPLKFYQDYKGRIADSSQYLTYFAKKILAKNKGESERIHIFVSNLTDVDCFKEMFEEMEKLVTRERTVHIFFPQSLKKPPLPKFLNRQFDLFINFQD